MKSNQQYIKKTFELAKKGVGFVSPNPLVGAIIVKKGKIIGSGYHSYYGGPHAEVAAFNNCSEDPAGATLYCNLEPCCHLTKKTPPCVLLIIKKKIKKVVISNIDPNPEVSGLGIKQLIKAGIEVIHGVEEEEGAKLNQIFFKYMNLKKTFVIVKVAQTLDGKTCLKNGNSKWISNNKSREGVHFLRRKLDAVCVGIETVLKDNPLLNVRNKMGKTIKAPYKIIIGNPLKLKKNLNVVKNNPEKTIVFFHSHKVPAGLDKKLGIQIIKLKRNHFEENLLEHLAQKKITSVLIEGGEFTITSFLKKDLVDKMIIYIAPKIFGEGKGIFKGKFNLKDFKLEALQNVEGDILAEYSHI